MTPAKRLFDIVLALWLGAILLLPAALIALWLLAAEGRPVFYLSERMRAPDGSYRREHLRAVAQRVEVLSTTEIKIMGSRTELLRTLAASGGEESAILRVRSFKPKWRARNETAEGCFRALCWACAATVRMKMGAHHRTSRVGAGGAAIPR